MAGLSNHVQLAEVPSNPKNYFRYVLRFFDVLPNFPFTTSEIIQDYYLYTAYVQVLLRVAERLKTYDLWKLGNIRKVPKLPRMIA